MSEVSKLPPRGYVYAEVFSPNDLVLTVERFDDGGELSIRLTRDEVTGLVKYLLFLYAVMLLKSKTKEKEA